MTDLPDSSAPIVTQPTTNVSSVTGQTKPMGTSNISSGNKESAPIGSGFADHHQGLSDATGQELELPKEVVAAGVRMQPTTVALPQSVAQLGVKPSGANTPVQTTSSVVLPLTDDQIAKGLHAEITNSVRWLAEWCVRRLKHLHITLKNVHGSFVRIKE